MVNYKGRDHDEAPPSTPVEVLGLNEVPDAGDVFEVVADEKEARQVAERKGQIIARTSLFSRPRRFRSTICSSRYRKGNVKDST